MSLKIDRRQSTGKRWPLRFGLRTILASQAVCALALWWWISWPDHTARGFRRLVAQRSFKELDELLRPEDRWAVVLLDESDLQLKSPRLKDLLLGRRRFRYVAFGIGGFAEISVSRGRVSCCRQPPKLSALVRLLGGYILVDANVLISRLRKPDGWLRKTVAAIPDDQALVDRIFAQVLGRYPTAQERRPIEQLLARASNREQGAEYAVWALLCSEEFLFPRTTRR